MNVTDPRPNSHVVADLLEVRAVVELLDNVHRALACGLADGVKEDEDEVGVVGQPEDCLLDVEWILQNREGGGRASFRSLTLYPEHFDLRAVPSQVGKFFGSWQKTHVRREKHQF